MALINEVMALLGNTFAKGDLFEDHVLRLFPEHVFSAMYLTTRTSEYHGRRVESNMNPDFQFRHIPTNHIFWVECKFRTDLFQGMIHWCEPWQFERYKRFQESIRPAKVFVVIGLGGRPSMPYELYCLPLDEIQYPALYPSVIMRYRRHPYQIFQYSGGRLY